MQPSISRENHGVRDCAALLLSYFQELGCQEAEIAETPNLPAVWAYFDAGAPKTLAVYGYFDSNIVGGGWDHDPYAGVLSPRPPSKRCSTAAAATTREASSPSSMLSPP